MKNILSILFGTCLLISCSNDEASVRNREIANNMFEAFNNHDWKKMAGYYAEPAEFLDPSFGKEYVSKQRKETIEKYAGYQQIIPDIRDNVKGVYAAGDKVIVEFVSTGTIAGGSAFSLPIVSILTLKDGLIVKDATYYDQEMP